MKKYLIILAVMVFALNSSIVPQENGGIVFSREEMENISKILTKVQIEHSKMLITTEEILKYCKTYDSGNSELLSQESKKEIFEKYKYLDLRKEVYCFIDSSYLNLTHSLIFENSLSRVYLDSSTISLCYDCPVYYIAIGLDGEVFFLDGFERHDFNSFIKHKVKSIKNKDIAYNVLKLYLDLKVLYGKQYLIIEPSIFKDKNKILNYSFPEKVNKEYKYSTDSSKISIRRNKKLLSCLYPLKLKETDNKYEFNFITLDRNRDRFGYARLMRHKFTIYKNCKIKHISKVIKY